MPKNVYFIRSAKYDYNVRGLDLYDSFDLLAGCKIDPPIDNGVEGCRKVLENYAKIPKVSVFCADDKRCFQTALLISAQPRRLKLLSEINYSMANILTKDQFFDEDGVPNIEKARKMFVDAIMGNRLQEGYVDMISRVKTLINVLKNEEAVDIIAISHGFFMKIIEAYVKDRLIEYEPERLRLIFDVNKISFDFLEGFVLDLSGKDPKLTHEIKNQSK
jgi:broad specificity phosphatase PhoE